MDILIVSGDDWQDQMAEYAVEALSARNQGETLAEMWQRRIFPAWYPVRAHFLGRVRAADQGKTIPVPQDLPDGLVKLGCESFAAAWTYMRIQQDDMSMLSPAAERRFRRLLNEGPLS